MSALALQAQVFPARVLGCQVAVDLRTVTQVEGDGPVDLFGGERREVLDDRFRA